MGIDKPYSIDVSIDTLQEKCAIFGVYGLDFYASRLVHPGLWALQHRGQESSGIVSSDGEKMYVKKGAGLVAHVYSEFDLQELKGNLAIGHNRYSTSGASMDAHAQPIVVKVTSDKSIALAHNGNLPSTKKIAKFLSEKGVDVSSLNDSEMMTHLIAYFVKQGQSLVDAVKSSWDYFTGAFSIVVMDVNNLIAARDGHGIRPLCIGKLNGGFIFASETCGLDIIGAKFVRDVRPGEIVLVNKNGLQSFQVEKGSEQLDIFELVYFARPDSIIKGRSVDEIRQNLGRELAREHQIEADIVIPVPDSAIPASLGYAHESGVPFYMGLIKNRYVHRTFISPEAHTRHKTVQLKLNPMPHIIKNKRVILVDDSIVRGTTSRGIVKMVREAGAKSVHLVISSPPVRFPDFYGINTPNQSELIASYKDHVEITKEIGADSLHYLSYAGLIRATGQKEVDFCTACFTGSYPIDIAERRDEINYQPAYRKI